MDYDWRVELPKAVREIPREELERYVRVFEDDPGSLKQFCRYCALGAMAGVHEGSPGARGRWLGMERRALVARMAGDHDRYAVIEDLFEGFADRYSIPLPSDPRLAIYEACVVELARRDSESTAPAKEAVGVGVG